MKKIITALAFVFLCLLANITTQAQDINLADLQGNIEIFAGVLEDALELNQNSGLFGMSLGGLDATYLYRQGVLIEVRSPLANQRNRLSLVSLNSAMQSMQTGINPFERMVSRTSPSPVLSFERSNENADSFYELMMERIAKIDYSLIVSNSIQQASDSARSLRALGNIDESTYEELRAELDVMRERFQENIDQLSQLEEELGRETESSGQSDSEAMESEVSSRLDNLIATLEPLREQAMAKAEQLKEQMELAEQRYLERWHEEVSEFEESLYVAMCNYGSTLRELPNDESISVILKGLGEDEANSNRRSDKVHVLSKSDVQECQNGVIDAIALRDRSAQYSY